MSGTLALYLAGDPSTKFESGSELAVVGAAGGRIEHHIYPEGIPSGIGFLDHPDL
jgi:hypothetical protein